MGSLEAECGSRISLTVSETKPKYCNVQKARQDRTAGLGTGSSGAAGRELPKERDSIRNCDLELIGCGNPVHSDLNGYGVACGRPRLQNYVELIHPGELGRKAREDDLSGHPAH